MTENGKSEAETEHTLFIVERDDLDDAAPYQVTMLEHPPDSAQATAVEEAMRQLVETAEEETGELRDYESMSFSEIAQCVPRSRSWVEDRYEEHGGFDVAE